MAVNQTARAPSEQSIFGPLVTLPRGPHGLPREQVAGAQRVRLLAALSALVAEKGYAGASVTETARRAGVSPNVFYEHFAGKEECFLAAYDAFAAALLERIGAGLRPRAGLAEFITSALEAYLGALEDDPVLARAFLIEVEGAGPAVRARRRRAYRRFAELLKQGHDAMRIHDPTLGQLPDRAYLAIGQGVRALVCDELESRRRPRLRELVPDAALWITATMRGAAAAANEASAPGSAPT